MTYAPERGDIVRIRFNPQSGHEQAGCRTALVLSPLKYNAKTGLFICCPVTSQEKGYPFEVKIPKGLPVSGIILSDQVKSLDWQARQAEFLCVIPEAIINTVIDKLSLLLQI